MKILLVEDDHRISSSIKKGFEQESFIVDVAFNGETGYDLASLEEYDVIILDLMLPLMDGIQVCKSLRADKNNTPILMLTAKTQTSDKVFGLDSGADDYLAKPFSFDELIARVRALSRRPKQLQSETLSVDDLILDTKAFEVSRAGEKIKLSKKEFTLLEYLLKNVGATISKDQLIQNVWNFDADVLPNTVEVYVGYLRNKIDKSFSKSKKLIHTVRGFGYKLESK